ncbi:hypothetical protein SASPL_129201 [Salvia splendens]|uniref:Uncharacterized protein n=1 Tax=Salvia splendens TaxID=180675 RepID=A0A8X8XDX4_SALSN|nr:hypothetical protein SASPL_129201 [Salvia splendens]
MFLCLTAARWKTATTGWPLYDVLFCFFISVVSSLLAAGTRYPFLRRRSIWIGSLLSFAAGAAKEFADELGYFKSAGASAKDAVADLIGILLAAVILCLLNYRASASRAGANWPDQHRSLTWFELAWTASFCVLLLMDIALNACKEW